VCRHRSGRNDKIDFVAFQFIFADISKDELKGNDRQAYAREGKYQNDCLEKVGTQANVSLPPSLLVAVFPQIVSVPCKLTRHRGTLVYVCVVQDFTSDGG